MNTPKIHHLSSQIGQKIISSSRIPYFGVRNSILSKKKSGLGWMAVPTRGYTIPSTPGSGAGKGGGAGGSVRESGGALGQYGAAHEEEFFYNKQREQLEKMKTKLKKEEAKPPKITRKEGGEDH
ncbi:uncharacterized protein LOC114350298 [Ostrinia furnacalis]|uniref:uncharacterized protein LOC114350298 n=1 Tax=Ostrinia furnacalis TaxID=93504 RepID=UPI00103D74FA|nr:uncharacterized protein LOC114350298 [Ostrinia furnacalis]